MAKIHGIEIPNFFPLFSPAVAMASKGLTPEKENDDDTASTCYLHSFIVLRPSHLSGTTKGTFMAKPSSPKRPIDGEASKPPSFFVYGSGQPRARRYWFVMVVIRGGSADEGGITMLKTNYYGDLKKATHGYSLLC